MKSLKLKWVLMYLALVFIVMIFSGTFMLSRVKIQETNEARDVLTSYAKKIHEQVILGNEEASFPVVLKEIATQSYNPIEGNILNNMGVTIASTASQNAEFVDSSIISALSKTEKFTVSKDLYQYREWFNYAYPILDENKQTVKYVIFARMDAQSMNTSLWQQSITMAFTVVLALILTGLLGFLFANTLTDPIIMLTKKSKEIANGQLDQVIEVESKDEIGQLAESFNHMVKELRSSISNMASEKNKMEIIQHNMSDGVLAYDYNGSLIHANYSALELLNLTSIQDVPFAEMMQILCIDITDIRSLQNDVIKDSSFSIGEKFINANFTPYFDKDNSVDGLVVVLQDITKHKKLDDMRKEFVANVSHEIRTPLTTIKSYAETLLDGALDDRAVAVDFLEVINSETDRMTLLVKDLLDLTRFDSKQLKMEMQSVDLITLLKKCIRQNIILAEKKNQTMDYEDFDAKFIINGDPYRINQVFTNIISNAIKYTNENGKINISIEETDKYFRIYIKDSGMGIPKEDLPRIFERFYRVDKARSRQMGGTGLGLAIAREIMEAHSGKILATSEVGRGTTMILRFSKTVNESTETV